MDYPARKFSNYNQENGVPLSAPNERSLYKTRQGEIFIGGTDGMVSFKEKDIDYAPGNYTISPFRLLVNGQEVNAGDQSHILAEGTFPD